MKSENYKKIAEIIKDFKEYHFEEGEEFSSSPVHHSDFKALIKDLADYFEEEECNCPAKKGHWPKGNHSNWCKGLLTKRQFLKDCGVE